MGTLLKKGTWDQGQIRHASYTLRLGSRVEIARAAESGASEVKQFTIVTLTTAANVIDLKPGDTALLYSMENLKIPTSILGFTVARGLLFAESLVPENTYVDPGFSGSLYTTVTNVSNRIIRLEYGMPVARLFFFRLAESVRNGYRTGAALGISQQLASMKTVQIGSAEDCKTASDKDLIDAVRQMPLGGSVLAEIVQGDSPDCGN
jgi:deoxycytidine triphosphate deaminase